VSSAYDNVLREDIDLSALWLGDCRKTHHSNITYRIDASTEPSIHTYSKPVLTSSMLTAASVQLLLSVLPALTIHFLI
jgi:hypothetical protein